MVKNYGDYDFLQNIQILTPTKKGKLGTKELNKNLQNVLNPKTEEMKCKTYGEIEFREGDRVMQIKNNYDIYWEKRNVATNLGTEHGSGVFNGELGILSKINNTDKNIEVQFDDGKTAWYAFSELDQLEHAYAITIHKAQRTRIVPQASSMLLTRNLLYTGMTRAKKMLIIIGNRNLIEMMVQNFDIKKRNTGLKYKIIDNE